MHALKTKLILLSGAIGLVTLAWWWPQTSSAVCHFTALDVGQGDALLIQTADHQDILVDGGPNASVLNELSRFLPAGDRQIELVILTHPDADHSTGLVYVLQRFPVQQIFVSDIQAQTDIYQAWQKEVTQKNIPVRTVTQGEVFELGLSTKLEVLWPPKDWRIQHPKVSTNDVSVSLRVTCAGSTVVMTGDGSSTLEEGILQRGMDISAPLLKVGHHGSRTSSTHEFLKAVHPRLAVISVGKKNHYGHPHPATLERLKRLGIRVFRTDQLGSVRLDSDGRGGWTTGVDKTQ